MDDTEDTGGNESINTDYTGVDTSQQNYAGGNYGGGGGDPSYLTDVNVLADPYGTRDSGGGGGGSFGGGGNASTTDDTYPYLTPMSQPDFGTSSLGGIVGGSGGGDAAAQLSYQQAMAQLAEQTREYNTTAAAQQASAGQAATGITNLVNQYNQAYAQAVSSYNQTYNQMLGVAQSTTGQQQADVRSQYAAQAASGMQNLQRQGMGGSTVGAVENLGIQNQQSQALNRLADTMQQTELGIMANKKTNQQLAPSTTLIQSALNQMGNYGPYGGTGPQALSALNF